MFQVISSDFHVFPAWSLNSLPSTAQTQWQYIQLTPLTQRDSPPVLRGYSLSSNLGAGVVFCVILTFSQLSQALHHRCVLRLMRGPTVRFYSWDSSFQVSLSFHVNLAVYKLTRDFNVKNYQKGRFTKFPEICSVCHRCFWNLKFLVNGTLCCDMFQ